MRKLLTAGFLLGLLSWVALAADVTGKWVASMPGRDGQAHEVTFTLKADGNALTGTISSPRGDSEIAEGKINGDQISFSQTMNFGGREFKQLFSGTVAGDEIKFTRTREGGDGRSQEFTAKRAQ